VLISLSVQRPQAEQERRRMESAVETRPTKRVAKWRRALQADESVRHHLYINGEVTPYFIDVARYHAHKSYGSRIGLWGAGFGANGIAGFLGGFDKISDAKAYAEFQAYNYSVKEESR
jgi:hypothetical protein